MADQNISLVKEIKSKAKDLSLIDLIIDSIQDIKGKNIVKLDLSQIEDASSNCYIICEGESTIQVKAISRNIQRRVREEMGLKIGHVEGEDHGRWVLLDYFEAIIHVFYHETRIFYDIEDLWSDAEFMYYEDL